jgi:para-nitrobenzyl esterase
VWAPANATHSGEKLPVMVFFHGGSYVMGSGQFDGSRFVSRSGGQVSCVRICACVRACVRACIVCGAVCRVVLNVDARKVILVSINYRLNAFGFMALNELSHRDSRGVSGNYGVTDMIASLEVHHVRRTPRHGTHD